MFKKRDYGFITDEKTINNRTKIKSYTIWNAMIQRCYNPNNKSYKTYGAKGVTICEEWKLFSNFRKWYDENYIEGYSIDKDIKGGKIYSPNNCIFVSKEESTKEVNSRKDNTCFVGQKNPNSKTKEYYERKPIRRWNFKNACRCKGWIFEDFKEIDSGIRTSNGTKKYYYVYKEKV